jgi:hypothetical protein
LDVGFRQSVVTRIDQEMIRIVMATRFISWWWVLPQTVAVCCGNMMAYLGAAQKSLAHLAGPAPKAALRLLKYSSIRRALPPTRGPRRYGQVISERVLRTKYLLNFGWPKTLGWSFKCMS